MVKKMNESEMRKKLKLIKIRREFLKFLQSFAMDENETLRPFPPIADKDEWVKKKIKEILDL